MELELECLNWPLVLNLSDCPLVLNLSDCPLVLNLSAAKARWCKRLGAPALAAKRLGALVLGD